MYRFWDHFDKRSPLKASSLWNMLKVILERNLLTNSIKISTTSVILYIQTIYINPILHWHPQTLPLILLPLNYVHSTHHQNK